MSVAYLGVTRVGGSGWSGTSIAPPANADFALVFAGAYPGNLNSNYISSMTFKGNNFTNIRQDRILGEAQCESWWISANTVDMSSSGTFVATPGGGSPTSEEVCFILWFSGVHQTAPIKDSAGVAASTGTGDAESASVTSDSDGFVAGSVTTFSTTDITATSPGTERDELQNTANLMDHECQTSPGTGASVTVAWGGMNNNSDRAANVISLVAAAGGAIVEGTVAEGISFDGSLNLTATLLALMEESVILEDIITNNATLLALAQEEVILEDTGVGNAIYPVDAQETILFEDTVARTAIYNASVAEGLGLADANDRTAAIISLIAEALLINDLFAAVRILEAAISEGIILNDSYLATVLTGILGTVADGAIFADTVANTLIAVASTMDQIILGDALSALAVLLGLQSEGVVFSDVLSVIATELATVSEQSIFSDAYTAQLLGPVTPRLFAIDPTINPILGTGPAYGYAKDPTSVIHHPSTPESTPDTSTDIGAARAPGATIPLAAPKDPES